MAISPQQKSDSRRALAGNGANALNAVDPALIAHCEGVRELAPGNSQATFALGIYTHNNQNYIRWAAQAGANLTPELIPGGAFAGYIQEPSDNVGHSPGLHAEMMVIRSLMLTGLLDPNNISGSAVAINLRIVCPAKLCCPDCAGWMTSQNIAYYPVAAGNNSPNWVHPRTGACFRVAGGEVKFWNKHGRQYEGDPIGIGNLGAIARVG